MNLRYLLSRCLIFVPLLGALLFILPIRGIPISPDGAWYSGLALNLYNGNGFVDLNGAALFNRPLFPAILAAAYYLLGPSPFSSLLVLRLFYLLTVLLVTLLARSLYGAWTGCVAGLLVITSYALNEWSTWINLDPILPAFLLLFLLLFHLALRGNNKLLYLLAGVALAAALLVKETALLFFGLPLLILIFRAAEWPRRQILGGALLTWIASALTLAPWLWYVLINSGDPWQMVGSTPQWASRTVVNLTAPDSPPTSNLFGEPVQAFLIRVQNYIDSFPNFYDWHLAPNFLLAPLLLFAFLVICSASFRFLLINSPLTATLHANRYLALSVLTFAPMIVLQGVAGFRSRQSIIIFLLLMIAVAYLATIPMRWWSQLSPITNAADHGRRLFQHALLGLALVPALALVSWQACCDRPLNMADHLRNFNSVVALTQPADRQADRQTVRSPSPWWPTEAMIHSSRSFAGWAEEANLGPELRILTHDNHHRYLNLFTSGEHRYFRIPSLGIPAENYDSNMPPLHLVLLTATQPNAVLWNNVGKDEPDRFNRLRAYTQEQILATVAEKQIDYVVVGYPEKWLATYFLAHPDFQKVAEFEYGTAHLFEVTDKAPSLIDLPPTIDKTAANLLHTLQRSESERYTQLLDTFFVAQLGWTPQETLEAIAESRALAIEAGGFSYPQYIRWANATFESEKSEEEAEEREIIKIVEGREEYGVLAISEKKAARNPQNPWPQIALGAFYEGQGLDDENQVISPDLLMQAVDAYQQALLFDPQNWRAAWRMTELHRVTDGVVDDTTFLPALATYERAIEQRPSSERTFRELASVYTQLDRPTDAISAYTQAIERGVADAGTYLSLGWIHQRTLEDVETAMSIYAAGAAVAQPDDPKYDRLFQHLGKLYVAEGNIESAVALYQKAAYERVGVAWPHLEIGKLYLNLDYQP